LNHPEADGEVNFEARTG